MIAWDNLWKPFVLTPGTVRVRVLLTCWEFQLWVWPWLGGVLGGVLGLHWWPAAPWWVQALPSLPGGLLGGVIAFELHELLFIAYAEHIVGLHELPAIDALPMNYIPTLERYKGPMA